MALDRSSESFSPQNEFYLLCSYCSNLDPLGGVSFDLGYHMNKIDKAPQGDATYQKPKLYPLQFQRRRILKLVFFVLCDPWGGASFDPQDIT